MSIETIKMKLAMEILKAQRDVHFKRMKPELLNNEITRIKKEAALRSISINELLSLAQEHTEIFEEQLEQQYNSPYITDGNKKEALPVGR